MGSSFGQARSSAHLIQVLAGVGCLVALAPSTVRAQTDLPAPPYAAPSGAVSLGFDRYGSRPHAPVAPPRPGVWDPQLGAFASRTPQPGPSALMVAAPGAGVAVAATASPRLISAAGQGGRLYSVHRDYGLTPDPAPVPPDAFTTSADLAGQDADAAQPLPSPKTAAGRMAITQQRIADAGDGSF